MAAHYRCTFDWKEKAGRRAMTSWNKSASTFLAAGLALAVTLGTAHAAAAKDVTVVHEPLPDDALSRSVSYADLDLTSAADVGRLTFRVRSAVNYVCAPLDQRVTFAEHGACRSYAWNGARPQMDLAVARAQQLASVGTTSIAPVGILISTPSR
jgi:UrcA family protein